MRYATLTFALVLAVATSAAQAYETSTHAYMTAEAFDRSVLSNTAAGSIWVQLGFDRLDAERPFHTPLTPVPSDLEALDATNVAGEAYFDLVPQGSSFLPTSRNPYTNFESTQIDALIAQGRFSNVTNSGSFVFLTKGWLSRGAIREDDLKDGDSNPAGTYDDDPSGNMYRVFNHFYDPVGNHGFAAIVGANALCLLPNQSCERTIDWATGLTDALASSPQIASQYRNHFSWEAAREAQWRALTLITPPPNSNSYTDYRRQDSVLRLAYWATAFRALGDAVHLLQDMAQPQHTRQDIHPPAPTWLSSDFLNRQIYEAYTDLRVTRDFSEPVQSKSLLRDITGGFPSKTYTPQPVLGNYPTIALSSARKYFSSQAANPSGSPSDTEILSRRGLADYSNRGFFTAGTLPGSALFPYTLPPNNLSDSGYSELPTKGSLWINNSEVSFSQIARVVPDVAVPGYADPITSQYGGKVPLMTAGVWTDYSIMNLISTSTVVLDLYNYQVMADMLMPRAVGYSTGLINYFFRGKITVEAPLDGLFSVTDQGVLHTTDLDGYPFCTVTVPPAVAGEPAVCTADEIYGFTKLRLKVRNNTDPIAETGSTGSSIPQNMASTIANPVAANDPQLVAVARYHRNLCYASSLKGEIAVNYAGALTTPTCANGNRSTYQEISVSAPAVMAATALNSATSTAITFDFTDNPIPINATDLIVQVVYRGPLGEEVDGIAVGAIDVREPSYLTVWNNSDHAGCNGSWVTGNAAGCDYMSGGTALRPITTARMCIGTQLLYTRFDTGGNSDITVGNYVRLAALMDNLPHPTLGRLIVGVDVNVTVVFPVGSLTGQQRQASKERVSAAAPYQPDPMYTKRGIVGSFRPLPFYLMIGANPQPSNDTGPTDVGALTPLFSATADPLIGGTLSFPNTPVTSPACTPPSTQAEPFFEDELRAAEAANARAAGMK